VFDGGHWKREKKRVMKTLFPWLCVVVLAAATGLLYTANGRKDAEIATLKTLEKESEQLRTENADLKKAQVPEAEIERLRREADDVLRLRNEVRQLRDGQKQLTQQAQAAQAEAQRAQAQAQAERQHVQEQAQALAQARAGAAALAKTQTVDAMNACINNLRQIDGAIQQWALENQKSANSPVTAQDITPYLKNGFPSCPAGGTYTLSTVGQMPTCSIPGHALPVAPQQ
jgi:hypothetical protein